MEGKSVPERKLKRRHLIYYLEVFDAAEDKLLGHLGDITAEGVMVLAQEPIPTESSYNLKIILPKKLKSSQNILLEAKSVWCREDVNPELFAAGFQLVNTAPNQVDMIERLILDISFQD